MTCAGVAIGRVLRGSREELLATAAHPAIHLVSDRGQLALLGFRTLDQIDANSRMASLEDCRRLGEEHGGADAQDFLQAENSIALKTIAERQCQRASQRIRRLVEAGLSAAQLEAYSVAAAETFRSFIEQR